MLCSTELYRALVVIAIIYNVAAAVCISCQELTSTLRDRSHACRGEEVYFTCIIRGSANSPNLILAWSSTEYIGRGTPLQFTTATVPGENRTSVINRNVTATLISNANISGVPTLVSELRIIADQASTVICTSETITGGETSGVLNVSGTCVHSCIACNHYVG